jgi:hypothetical protein
VAAPHGLQVSLAASLAGNQNETSSFSLGKQFLAYAINIYCSLRKWVFIIPSSQLRNHLDKDHPPHFSTRESSSDLFGFSIREGSFLSSSSAFHSFSLQQTKLIDIPPFRLEVVSEFNVFGSDGVLTDVRKAEENEECRQDTETA